MSHELDENEVTGRKAMFSVGATPWHREGFVVETPPTFDEAMALAGADYEVGLRHLFVSSGESPTPGGLTMARMGRAVVRLDRGTVLSDDDVLAVVSDKYAPLQNREAFGVFVPLIDRGVVELETGGTLRGGRDAWMLGKFNIADPVVQEVFAGEVVPYALVTNNHSAEARVLVMETPIRVVCANTLGMAVSRAETSRAVAVAHRGDARVKVVEAAERLFVGLVERYRVIAEQYRLMRETRFTVDEFVASVLDSAAPLPPPLHTPEGMHLTTRGYDLAHAAAEKRRAAIRMAWTGGKGHVGDHSAWEAYNGAVEVIDHDSVLFRTNGSRVASLMAGRLLDRKAAVLNAVVRTCRRGGE